MQRRMLALIVSVTAAHSAFASVPVRNSFCSDGIHYYYDEDRFINDLRGVAWNQNVFDYDITNYALVHCGASKAVVVAPNEKHSKLSFARTSIVEMIASDKKETFQDVVDRLTRLGFNASLADVAKDSCLCFGDN